MKKIPSNPAKTVLTIATGFLAIHLIFKWTWPLYLSFVLGLAGVFSSFLSKKIEWAWLKLAWLLSLIVPNVLLTVIFYSLLFPIALAARWFRQSDPLLLKNSKRSTFTERQKEFDKSSFEKPW